MDQLANCCSKLKMFFQEFSSKFNEICIRLNLFIATIKYVSMMDNFRLYFRTMKEIVNDVHGLGANRVTQLKVIICLVMAKIVHEAFLMGNVSDYWRLLHCDYLQMASLPSELHLITILIYLLTLYVFKQLYFYDTAKYFKDMNIVGQVLFEQHNTYLLPPKSGQVPKEVHIRRLMQQIFFQSHGFTLGLTLLMALIQWYYLAYVFATDWRHYLLTVRGVCELLFMQFNLCFFDFCLLSMATVNMVAGSYSCYFTISSFTRMKQINERFLYNIQGAHVCFYLRKFMQLHTETLLVIFSFSHIFGNLLTAYIVINFPVNSFLCRLIVSGRISNVATLFYVILIVGQSFYIIVFHLMSAKFTDRIHNVTPKLMQLMLSSQLNSISHRIKLLNYISKFHCTNQYSIKYHQFGKVTMMSCLKVRNRQIFKKCLVYNSNMQLSYSLEDSLQSSLFTGSRWWNTSKTFVQQSGSLNRKLSCKCENVIFIQVKKSLNSSYYK